MRLDLYPPLLLICALVPRATAQAGPTTAAQDDAAKPAGDSVEEGGSAHPVEELRARIHAMRMNLILGGDQVRSAESEAVDFYGNKIELIDKRRDAIAADLSEKRTSYDIALQRALDAEEPHARTAAMSEAQTLQLQIDALAHEADELTGRRAALNGLISGVDARLRAREELRDRLEDDDSLPDDLGLSLGSVGLAPDVPLELGSAPLEDERLIQDILRRDPVAGRRMLFDMDPGAYWNRFPLRPPAAAVQKAFAFPQPDLPGGR